MGALPRPDLATGPARELNDALHDLHHRAGWPSLRTLAHDAGCSHTTVSHVFSSPKLPAWGVVELLVEAMSGVTAEFHGLWLAASAPVPTGTNAASRIAGRRSELVAVRHHLESGCGLLLVIGEAGMGKTKLVTTAASMVGSDTVVVTGHCLPLSSEVPLLPIADVLRAAYDVDDGDSLRTALAVCAEYVPAALAPMLPELAADDRRGKTPDGWTQHTTFTAVGALLTALASPGQFAVLIEDLHWADGTTLDLLEHLLVRGTRVPVLGTYRIDDLTTPSATGQWLARIERLPAASALELGPLTQEETGHQLALLSGRDADPAVVAEIHARAQGQPLFAEQLYSQSGDSAPLPRLLEDLLAQRLGDLGPAARAASVGLGIADRPLDETTLQHATGLSDDDLVAGLHELDRRRLLAPARRATDAELRHPLLAEAIRAHLVPSERRRAHARVAEALQTAPEAAPAEIAAHWQASGNSAEELRWRIAAATDAGESYGWASEGHQWLRILDLWPDDTPVAGTPPVRLCDAYIRAMDAFQALDLRTAAGLGERALVLIPHLAPVDAAAIWVRAGDYFDAVGDRGLGRELVDRAVAVYTELPASEAGVRALLRQSGVLQGGGQFTQSRDAVRQAAAMASALGDPGLERYVGIEFAWSEAKAGDFASALELAERAWAITVTKPIPQNEINAAADFTDLLLITAAPVAEIAAVAERALALAAAWEIESYAVSIIRSNASQGLLRAGQVKAAAALIDPVTGMAPHLDGWAVHLERACLDVRRGRLDEATERFEIVWAFEVGSTAHRVESAGLGAEIDLWCARPERALERLRPELRVSASTGVSQDLGTPLVMAARAAADLSAGREQELAAELVELLESCLSNPFGPRASMASRRALPATWHAELGRLTGTATLEDWLAAAAAWDKLDRPHDSAYARWRAAKIARATGQAGLADTLLRRAARDAREHVPLLAVIRGK